MGMVTVKITTEQAVIVRMISYWGNVWVNICDFSEETKGGWD
jgi:cytosine/uracil/thiamine/allantoin permease